MTLWCAGGGGELHDVPQYPAVPGQPNTRKSPCGTESSVPSGATRLKGFQNQSTPSLQDWMRVAPPPSALLVSTSLWLGLVMDADGPPLLMTTSYVRV